MVFPTAKEVLYSGGCLTYDADEPNIFYHCTPVKNVKAILKQGLAGGHGKTFGTNTEKHAAGRIFLSSGYEEAVSWQGMVASHAEEDVAILQIKLTEKEINNLQLDHFAYGDGFVCSFYTMDKFSGSRISVADSGEGTGDERSRKAWGMEEGLLKSYIQSIIAEEIGRR